MIYVDYLKDYPKDIVTGQASKFGTSWCHMWSDGGEGELIYFAVNIVKLKKSYIQRSNSLTHFDLIPSKRKLAIKGGAVEMTLVDWYRYQKIKKAEDNEETKERMRVNRKKNFKCELKKDVHQFLYDDEIYLSTTQNGYQWSGISCNTRELVQIYKKIREYLIQLKEAKNSPKGGSNV